MKTLLLIIGLVLAGNANAEQWIEDHLADDFSSFLVNSNGVEVRFIPKSHRAPFFVKKDNRIVAISYKTELTPELYAPEKYLIKYGDEVLFDNSAYRCKFVPLTNCFEASNGFRISCSFGHGGKGFCLEGTLLYDEDFSNGMYKVINEVMYRIDSTAYTTSVERVRNLATGVSYKGHQHTDDLKITLYQFDEQEDYLTVSNLIEKFDVLVNDEELCKWTPNFHKLKKRKEQLIATEKALQSKRACFFGIGLVSIALIIVGSVVWRFFHNQAKPTE